jgi:hypothetical protein
MKSYQAKEIMITVSVYADGLLSEKTKKPSSGEEGYVSIELIRLQSGLNEQKFLSFSGMKIFSFLVLNPSSHLIKHTSS